MAASSRTTTATAPPPKSPESYQSLNRRNAAAEMLQSYEKLSWYSFQRCESLTQTRLHFQNIIAGFTEEDEAALVDWPEDRTPRPREGEEAKGSSKGKERMSGGADVVAGSSAAKDSSRGKDKEKNTSGKGRDKSASSQGGSAKKKRRSGG